MPSAGGMILLIFLLILGVPTLVILLVVKGSQFLRKRKLAAYTGRTQGTVHRLKRGGLDHPDVIEVWYTVGGTQYQLRETVKLKSEWMKVGGIPIGQRKVYRMGNVGVGDSVAVQYDEENPARGLLPENEGVING